MDNVISNIEKQEHATKNKLLATNNLESLLQDVDVTLVDNSKLHIKHTHKQKRYNKKVWRFALDKDKRYRGPLSLFSLRIIAWICIIISQLVIVFELAGSMAQMTQFTVAAQWLDIFGSLSMPAFLLANFAYIIQNKKDSIRMLVSYFIMMMVVAGVFYFLFLHFIIGLFSQIVGIDYNSSYQMITQLVMLALNSTLKFNFFVDLFICSLFVYFYLGEPKKYFQGKKLIIFRLFALIPLGYEIVTIVMKVLTSTSDFVIPFLMAPFMPTKSPVTFLAFVFVVFFENRRKRKYLKFNGNIEEYDAYFLTNKNSWLFAKSAAKCFSIAGLIDLIFWSILAYSIPLIAVDNLDLVTTCSTIVATLEIGDSVGLLLFAPFILLFSYNRMFKPSKIDVFLPALSIIIIVVIYMEALYQAIVMLLANGLGF